MRDSELPLEGIRVIDFSEFVAAPTVAKLMADWGAEVVKVEKMSGDVWRFYGPSYGMPSQPDENPLFDIEHLNKKFLALDLKTGEGKEIMARLLSKADVFVTNFRMDALARLNLTYEDLSPKYPRLIYAFVQGFGGKGPDAGRPGFDVVAFWARCGAMIDLVPAENSVPINSPFGFGDHITGGILTGGICAALYKREKTGRGDKVYISLLASGIFSAGSMITSAQKAYQCSYPRHRAKPLSATGISYKCQDGEWILLSILDYGRYWPVLCERVLGRPELIKDERFQTKLQAVQNSGELFKILQEIFLTKRSDEWSILLEKADIAFEKIQHFSDVTEDRQAWANEYLFEHTFRNGNKAVLPKTPVQFESAQLETPEAGYGTRIGEHTKEILRDLGYQDSAIEELARKNIIEWPK